MEVIGSLDELQEKIVEGQLEGDFIHRPHVDEIKLGCSCGGKMQRTPDVLDVWIDSGVAGWAALHYPKEKEMFEGRKVSDRIVSIDRHYVRPIVRGKETKSVEFGAKVNNIQIDGISFIEHLSFKAFNEGIRLKDCIRMQQKLMNVRVRCVAADSIYANNANRKFCTKYGISTSFVRKGRAAKDEPLRKVLRSELSKERATRLEGSFGTQKQHYSLSRIKARNRKTEILWIFFGIHTANAILIIEKIRNKTAKAA